MRPTAAVRTASIAAAIVGAFAVVSTASATTEPPAPAPSEPTATEVAGTEVAGTEVAGTDAALRIMLTNDDGWNGGGLLQLRDSLVAAGHDVVVFAPADDQSGNSGRMTFGHPLAITQEEAGVFSVAGSPADSSEAGLSLAFPGELPDLVISGPNPGANIANASIHSGTIGATVTAANEGVPAIAVSVNGDPTADAVDYTITTEFVVTLVDALAANAGDGALLPDGLALNVNLPFVPAGEELAGVAITTTDRSYLDLDYSAVELPAVGASVDATAEFLLEPTAAAESDSAAIDAGSVSITFVEGNYDVSPDPAMLTEIETLTPLLTGLLG